MNSVPALALLAPWARYLRRPLTEIQLHMKKGYRRPFSSDAPGRSPYPNAAPAQDIRPGPVMSRYRHGPFKQTYGGARSGPPEVLGPGKIIRKNRPEYGPSKMC
ncbi:hypothetical protein J6590_047213 [Homalodisca vitripennis]|nr:hypothetical protein J6590_047213 [Homalodisca vitripennis]